ncbi:MAG: helix-turn-helix transcriptional regulator [Clostridia bacterium]|nr:helix-turn-helix transcriptional regulator [Clostridia bacterium]
MDYIEWYPKRVAELRIQKGVSAREMSLALGQSESYINKIENGRTLPSMTGFIYICEYLGISPMDFFDVGNEAPQKQNELSKEFQKLTPMQAEHILQLMKELNKNAGG